MKRSFSFFDIGNVLIAPIGRSSVFEQQRRGNGLFPGFYRFSEGFGQPIFEQSDAADGSGVADLTLVNQIWSLFQWELTLKCQEDILKCQALVFDFCTIPGKMHINAAARKLRVQVTEDEEFIRARQNMHGLS